MTKRAIITGITGQDGAYLADFLLSMDYKVCGTFRRSSTPNFWRIEELGIHNNPNLELVNSDITDQGSCFSLVEKFEPDEIYNLAAQSFVGASFHQPKLTADVSGVAVLNLLEAIKYINPKIKFYQASTSEMFGLVQEVPQTENTNFYPRSPYGIAKLFAHWSTINYRESYDIFGACGILFNHESPLRGMEFVTRKITDSVAKIKLGTLSNFELGNLNAKRDWGYAKDYVVGMWKMLQVKIPDTFILATNNTITVRDFLALSFKMADISVILKGEGLDEVVLDKQSGKTLVSISPEFYRPSEVDLLIGDASKANDLLDWKPKTTISELCKMMVEADLARNKV
jgi:GDPmannose 4,6-dehydratase